MVQRQLKPNGNVVWVKVSIMLARNVRAVPVPRGEKAQY